MAIPLTVAFPLGNPFLEWLGVEVDSYGEGKSQMSLMLRDEHMNSWKVAQGGVSMTLLDVAMGLASGTVAPKEQSCATIDMNCSFMLPGGHPGHRMVARAVVTHRSTTMAFCDATLWNGETLVAKASGTFKYLRKLETARRVLGAPDTEVALGKWQDVQADASAVRHTVFVQEQNVPVELEHDEFDAVCVHAVARDAGGHALATGRLLPDGHIGRMAVLKAARGKGMGSKILTALMQAAEARGDAAVMLNAQTHAQAFYAVHGFVVEGEEFMEAGIAHVSMRHVFTA